MTVNPIRSQDDQTLTLSVVVVTHNEAERIRACIESIFAVCRTRVVFEVILVDSNSTDETVELATEYPITILQITDDDVTTPGAGRYVGTKAARGEFILFVDGDMVLDAGWLPKALERLRSAERVAAVDGHLNDAAATDDVKEVDSVRGVALYDADVLHSVGGFDPHLRSLEDIHLGFQLREAGYELHRLPEVAARHPESNPFLEPFRRWRHGYMIGNGQVLRQAISSPSLLAKHLHRMRYRLILITWLCVGLVTLMTPVAAAAWLGLSTVGFGAVAVKLGVAEAVGFVVTKVIGIGGLVHGLFVRPKPREAFPMETVKRLQEGPVHFDSFPTGGSAADVVPSRER